MPRSVLPLTLDQRFATHFQGGDGPIQDGHHDIGAGLRGIGCGLPDLARGGRLQQALQMRKFLADETAENLMPLRDVTQQPG